MWEEVLALTGEKASEATSMLPSAFSSPLSS
jgi:hypothetical protein